MKKYKLSQQADDDLLTIFLEGINEWGYKQAEKYANELHDCFNILANHPDMGTTRKDLNKIPQSFVKGSHVIIYRIVEKDLIEIATILPQRMDIPNLIKKTL